ncbi:hypothetical protein Rhopal_007090-T1 [Rhodotorula paludigena]|uniref:Xylanolytic transcriptional activator regulatory domain-containing protein n=1 Tax=Rhodotorula paludigena TaxID=86838 RepID=A0AAV5GYB6_9BASI|nr:hypothetical protein Rhopal_007090-T1 [Rhodotorula paludigena]
MRTDTEPSADQRSARQDTRAHVERLEARIRELEAQLGKESSPEANAGDPGATARRLADLDLQSNAAPAGALTLDSEGQLRWHTETNAFDCQPVEPKLAHTSSKLAFLPVPLSSSLHRSLLDLAFTWHFDSWRARPSSPFFRQHQTDPIAPAQLVERDEFMEDLWTVLDPPPELCTDPSDSSTRGEPFIDAALELLSQEIAAPKFSSICGVMAIANYYGGTARPHRGWIYGGIAHRLVMDFGLHIDPPADSPIDEDLRVLRRKVFWAAFVNDVSWSLCIGRKTPFSLEEIHQPIPPFDASLAEPGTGALWPAEIRIQLIAWRVCRLHYSERGQALEEGVRVETVKRLHRDLLDIFDSLPDFCRGDSLTMSPDVLQIQLTYHGLILLLLKPYLVKPPDDEMARFAFHCCANASERIAKVVQQYQVKPTFRRAPNSVYQ